MYEYVSFYIKFKNEHKFLFDHSPNPTDALWQDQVVGIFDWTYVNSIGKSTLPCLIFNRH